MMPDLFQTRWANLITDYAKLQLSLLGKRVIYATIYCKNGDRVRWATSRVDINSLRTGGFARLAPIARDGDSWNLFLELVDGLNDVVYTILIPLKVQAAGKNPRRVNWQSVRGVLSPRPGQSVNFKLFNPSGQIPGFTLNLLRVQSSRDWKRKAAISGRPEKVPTRFKEDQPGTITTLWSTNFVRSEDNVTMIDSSGSLIVTDFQKNRSKVSTPNFLKKKKWELPVNPYLMTETKNSTRRGYERVESLDGFPVTTLSWTGPFEFFVSLPTPSLLPDSAAGSQAFKRLIGGIRSDDFNLAADLVQFRQVTRMIATNALRIANSYKSLKRGDFNSASRYLFGGSEPRFRKGQSLSAKKSLSRNWLELQYGWKPLLSDIGSIVAIAAKTYIPGVRVVRGSATIRSFSGGSITGPLKVSLASVVPYSCGTWSMEKQSKVAYGLRYTLSDSDRQRLAQTGFLSPVSLAWELLPFSFVVDWFYPIGPYLEGLTAFEGLTFVDGYRTDFVRETYGAILSHAGTHGVSPQRVNMVEKGGHQRSRVRMERVKISTWPSQPSIQLKNPISVTHAQNAIALLGATMRR